MLSIAHIHPLTSNYMVNFRGENPEYSRPNPVTRSRPGLFARAVRAVAIWYRRHKLLALLESFDDRMLSDIGVNRSDIPGFVARAFPWKPVAKNAPVFVARSTRTFSHADVANDHNDKPLAA